jgi:Gram-negative porin
MSAALILGSLARPALAEVTLIKQPKWELFTDGRVGGFLSYTNGDGFPNATATSTPFGGGISTNDANQIDETPPLPQPKLRSFRLRSGFLSNIFAFGARTQLGDTKVTSYIQFWSDIESESRRKYVPAPVDVRQGYVRLEGSWGDLIVGRQGTLFSRGAAEIDFLYGHGYGVGFPTAIDSSGTTAGHVGTGVLGPGFGAGMVYVTPTFAGLRLNAGLFDPVIIVGAWERTEYPRPEAELTFDRSFGTNAKVHLFVNGAYQPVYRTGEPDSTSTAAYGAGYGARAEFGPVHIGVAGHNGQGLGLYYALESSEASADASPAHRLRKSDGYYAQLQVALGHVDLNAGVGVSRVIPLKAETRTIAGMSVNIPADGAPDANGLRQSLIQYQLGMSAAFVYHFSENLHFDFDYFRASFKWQLGEKQNVNFFNSGLTATW